ncbi:MAG: hypothetical protein RLZZ70_539 [Candidatus Parcubacteria bacterium]|jgi:beta-N-acetylhexosaminidase
MRYIFLCMALVATIGVFVGVQYTQKVIHETNIPTTAATSAPLPLGRHFMIGHWATTPVASTTALITKYQLAGVIIMSAPTDVTEIKNWTAAWQAAVDYPLQIAIDQEGGPVSRLRGQDFDTTGQRDVTTITRAYSLGKKRGTELAALGITMNFAPVLDTATKPDSFLYKRVFPTDPVKLAIAMAEGLEVSGVMAVAKHFPGHPNTEVDSHYTLPVSGITPDQASDFIMPFASYIATSAPKAIMTAHVAYPNIDPLPVTLSPYWLTAVLRDQLQFDGLIITDDMSMQAITDTWSPAESSRLALRAGADIILLAAKPNTIVEVMNTLEPK